MQCSICVDAPTNYNFTMDLETAAIIMDIYSSTSVASKSLIQDRGAMPTLETHRELINLALRILQYS